MNQNPRAKVHFWIKFSGWFCLLPATTCLYLFQNLQGTYMSYLYLIELIITIVFGVFLLTTAKSTRWETPNNILRATIFAFIFVGLIEFIPLFIAYRSCKRLNS